MTDGQVWALMLATPYLVIIGSVLLFGAILFVVWTISWVFIKLTINPHAKFKDVL